MKIDSDKLREYLIDQRNYQLEYNSSDCYISVLSFIDDLMIELDKWEESI